MTVRPPAQPPQLPGFSYLRHLGSGGFADVFLYEEQLLRRQVAVKVLLSGQLGADALANFTNEANLMAQLSNHPSIVSVYQAGISGDGRPFLVMEYCSRPNLQTRYRAARFSEAETLRVGVQIAGAVETAHRAGIIHRDIKPANILVTEYGRPALTDFGIAATTASGPQAGLSVPWAPPESFLAGTVGDQRSDIYSLGATLYTLLAGRTPFELPGATNTSVDVMGRIQAGALPPIGRQGISASLEQVLATAMARRPEDRFGSAMELARALQRVQVELGMQPTTVDVVDETADVVGRDEDDGRTRIRSVVTINAQAHDSTPTSRGEFAATTGLEEPDTRMAAGAPPMHAAPPPVEETRLRVPAQVGEAPPVGAATAARPSRGRAVSLALLVVAVVAAAVWIGVALMSGQQTSTSRPQPTMSQAPVDPGPYEAIVPDVTDLAGKAGKGTVVFRWSNPDPREGDSYMWNLEVAGEVHQPAEITEPTVTVPVSDSGRTCIKVVLRRDSLRGSAGVVGCAK